jgi:metal-dependent amidase/aminoacylase/carboxypeptidase family protein
MRGTVRCLNPEDREMMEGRVRRVVEDTASAFGAKAELHWEYGYPVTVNDEDATEWADGRRARRRERRRTTTPTRSCRPRISPTC